MDIAIFNVSRVTLITGHLPKIDHRKLSKTWVSKARDISPMEIGNQVYFLGVQQTRKIAHISQFGP